MRPLAAVVAALAISAFAVYGAERAKPLIFGADEDFPPYSFVKDGSPSGFAVDLSRVLSPVLNRNISVKLMPPGKLLAELESGAIDGLIGIPNDESLEESVLYSGAVTKLDFAIFVLHTNDYVKDLKSLEGKVTAVPAGCVCLADIKKNRKIQILETATVPEALRAIKTGEATAAICEKNSAFHYIKEKNIQGLKIVGPPVGDLYGYAFGVKKDRADLREKLNNALMVLENNGTIRQLRRKWFGITLEPPFPWKKVSMVIGAVMGILILLMAGLWITSLNAAIKIKTHEIRMMSRKMRERDKLAVIGKLAGQIAHELRTPLSTINNAVFLIRRDGYGNRELFQKRLALLEKKVRLTSNILESILSYSSEKTATATTISIKECLEEVINDMDIPPGIRIKSVFGDEERLHVFMDMHQLYSVYRNLIQNSVQAIGEEGVITVEARAPEKEGFVITRISDSGPGLKGILTEKIFDLFSSTKTSGTGLGLPISRSIAETNGGSLYLERTDGTGTTFVVRLPCSDIVSKKNGK